MGNYRTIFISDVHLGARFCAADRLLDFLKHHKADKIYLIGDIIDFWALSRKPFFPPSHVEVLRKILKRSKQGVEIVYVTGNHDEPLRKFTPVSFGNIAIVDEHIHETADGRKFLIVHGDAYDQVVQYARWLAVLGDLGYTFLVRSNTWLNWVRRKLGLEYWSLSAFVKHRVKSAASFIGKFEIAVAREARERNLDGVICGHIHTAEIREIDGITYINDGDFAESCTAVVEHNDGRFEIIHWGETPDA